MMRKVVAAPIMLVMLVMLVMLAVMLSVGPARAETVSIPLLDGSVLTGELFRPQGRVVAPAIVALHGCGGAYPSRDTLWRGVLLERGHIVLFPDSFGSRGLGSQCRNAQRTVTSFGVRRQDAIASATFLAGLPEVPPGGVALLGWSDGGSTVVAAGHLAPDLPEGLIRGSVAFYPGCAAGNNDPSWRPSGRMLMLFGEVDDWTPIAPCRRLAERIGEPALTLVGYPGAYHDFDAPGGMRTMQNIPSSQNADKSVHAGTNPEAQAAALTLVPAFLEGLAPGP
jgi:dienelactone hydrolase